MSVLGADRRAASGDQVVDALSAALEDRRWLYAGVKRSVDVVLAVMGLVVVSPILLVAMLAISVSDPGPVLYRHRRCGRGGGDFMCLKLRTMVSGADAALEAQPDLAAAFRDAYKLADDPRVTRVGRVLRRTSIDELPQLWNVIRGDMSLVGPRPVTRSEWDEMYKEAATTVFSVRPGLTGLWQVSGRSSISYGERIDLDLQYVRDRSLALDLSIIARTPASMIRDAE